MAPDKRVKCHDAHVLKGPSLDPTETSAAVFCHDAHRTIYVMATSSFSRWGRFQVRVDRRPSVGVSGG